MADFYSATMAYFYSAIDIGIVLRIDMDMGEHWMGVNAADLDGDSRDDIVSIMNSEDGNPSRVFGLWGWYSYPSLIDLSEESDFSFRSTFLGNKYFLSSTGDVNNDGFDDILIGEFSGWGIHNGRVYLVLGRRERYDHGPFDRGVDLYYGFPSFFNYEGSYELGNTVCMEGDINGDGRDDVIIGELDNDEGGESAGKVYVFFNLGLMPGCHYPDSFMITSCPQQTISFYFNGTHPILSESIEFTINGFYTPHYSFSATESSFSCTPADPYDDGDTINYCLMELEDDFGNSLDSIICGSFIVDITTPLIQIIQLEEGSIVSDSLYDIRFLVWDSISGLNIEELAIQVNDTVFYFPDIYLAGDTFAFSPESTSVRYYNNDTVRICIIAADSPDVSDCPANTNISCIEFYVDTEAPSLEVVEPLDSTSTSCIDQEIVFSTSDNFGLDTNSIKLTINDSAVSADVIYFDGVSIIYFPEVFWPEGWVDICIDSIADIAGNLAEGLPECFSFLVDLTPPGFINEFPEVGDTIYDLESISIIINDTLSGLDSTSIVFNIEGIDYSIEDSGIYFCDGSVAVLYIDSLGINLQDEKTIDVCVTTADVPTYCVPNLGEFCWSFYLGDSYIDQKNNFTADKFEIMFYPNPFNSSVKITVVGALNLTLFQIEIYDINGRKVGDLACPSKQTMRSGESSSFGVLKCPGFPVSRITGSPAYSWLPSPSTPSGIYLVRAMVGDKAMTKKVVYLK